MTNQQLIEKARQIRLDSIEMIAKAGSGHPGGSLSAADLMVALYYSKMALFEDPHDERRDRFVLSKGHSNPPLYAILADKGYVAKEELQYLRRLHHPFQGHPESNKCPGVDCSGTGDGSLSHHYGFRCAGSGGARNRPLSHTLSHKKKRDTEPSPVPFSL